MNLLAPSCGVPEERDAYPKAFTQPSRSLSTIAIWPSKKLPPTPLPAISFSGICDLAPTWTVSNNQRLAIKKTFGSDPAVLKRASPVHCARRGAPRFLIMTAFADFPGIALDARRFADALRPVGAKEIHEHIFKGADHFSIVKLDDKKNAARRTVLGFMT